MGKKPLLAAVVLAILAILLVIPVHDTYTDEGDDYPQYPVHEKAESRYPNLGSDLNQLAANVEAEEADEKAAEDPSVHEAGAVAVTIYLSGETDWMVAFLEDNGGSPRNVGEDYIEAFVPVLLLGRLSEQPGVLRIREIVPPRQMGPAATGDDIEITLPEKAELKYPNLGSRLNQLVAGVEEGGASAREAAKDAPVRQEESAAVTIYLSGNVGGVVSFLEDNGGSPRNVGEDYIEAYVPVTLLGQLSEQPDVLRVREIVPPQPAGHPATHSGNTVSQGVDVHGAATWHDAGYKGRGVRVGIITTGFEGLSHLAGTELPSNIVARCYDENIYSNQITNIVSDCEYGGSHGTATAEAVVDMAPEVSLLVATPLTKGDLKTAVDWMIGQGVDVIVHPQTWTFDGPGDGTSPYFNSPLKAIDAAVSKGIIWVNAVGNQARNTWYGAFTDPDGDGFHNFSGDDEHNQISLDEGDRVTAFLRWDDSWGYADCDLSFYLLRRDGTWADLSDDDQNGNSLDDPFEFITYTATEAGDYFLAIRRWSFACSEIPDWLQMTVWSFASLEHYSYERHIGNPAESTNSGMLSVGAARWSDPSQIEWFSSRGPAIDGRTKPDIVGADCGRAVSYPDNNNNGCWFSGTSQSAAHVAGMAVLVQDRFPNYTPTQIASYLKDNAEQRGSPDPNNTWGHGFAKLPQSTPAVTCLTGGAVADSANNPGLAADCEVLLAAKDTLAGSATLNWSVSVPIDQWEGVAVGGTSRRVTGLNLGEEGLTGRIPAGLGSLTNLEELYLWENELTGPIPAALGSLTNLEELYLQENELTGPIPASLSNLTNLEVLYLGGNQLTGPIPAALGSLTNLEELYLQENELTGPIPASLSNLTNLEVLYLGGNQLTGPIPAALGSLTNLEELYLWENELTGPIPAALGSLTNLEVLYLGGNQLTGPIPAALGSLTNLEVLYLGGNQLTGPIPGALGSLTNLKQLQLSDNQLTGPVPSWLGSLTNLEVLYFSGNELTGPIPASLADLSNLRVLSLWGNQLTGPIPLALSSLTSLEVLSLGGNQLTGPVPAWLGSLTRLQELSLWGNQLTGTIPASLAGLSNLRVLYLWGNQLTGTIPTEMGSLANLEELFLGGNQLTGPIPLALSSLTSLERLSLSQNQLTGPIPTWLGSLANLEELFLSGNQLTGPIPASLAGLSNLRVLYLWGNQLTGTIPAEMGSLANLEELFLGGNQLTGCIPAGIAGVANNDLNQLGLPFCVGALGSPIISAITPGVASITVTWAAPSMASGATIIAYDLRYIGSAASDKSDANWAIVDNAWTTGSGALSYQISGLTSGTQYDVKVRAVAAAGDGPWSATAAVTPATWGAIRSFSTPSVSPGGQVMVTITANGFGTVGEVVETLPPGFSLAASSPGDAVTVDDREVSFILFRDTSLNYVVTAPSAAGSYSFSGVLTNFDREEVPVGGALSMTVGSLPSVSVSRAAGSEDTEVRPGSPVSLTATFSRPVSGFTVDDITVGNGTAGNFAGGGAVYTFDVTPNDIGEVAVDISAGAVEDADGNGNTAAPRFSLGITYDDDGDGDISKAEAIAAIRDYFSGGITKAQAIAVIRLYFA